MGVSGHKWKQVSTKRTNKTEHPSGRFAMRGCVPTGCCRKHVPGCPEQQATGISYRCEGLCRYLRRNGSDTRARAFSATYGVCFMPRRVATAVSVGGGDATRIRVFSPSRPPAGRGGTAPAQRSGRPPPVRSGRCARPSGRAKGRPGGCTRRLPVGQAPGQAPPDPGQ